MTCKENEWAARVEVFFWGELVKKGKRFVTSEEKTGTPSFHPLKLKVRKGTVGLEHKRTKAQPRKKHSCGWGERGKKGAGRTLYSDPRSAGSKVRGTGILGKNERRNNREKKGNPNPHIKKNNLGEEGENEREKKPHRQRLNFLPWPKPFRKLTGSASIMGSSQGGGRTAQLRKARVRPERCGVSPRP